MGEVVAVAIKLHLLLRPRRERVEEAVPDDAFDELAFVWRSPFDSNGERKTVIIGESDDFRSLATLRGPTASPLFWPP